MEYEKIIQSISNYGNISNDDICLIKKSFSFTTFIKNQKIISCDNPCNKLFFVNSGFLRAYYLNDNGKEITRMIAWEGRFLTNIVSLKHFSINKEFFECIQNAEVLWIDRIKFDNLLAESLTLKHIYLNILEEYSAANIKRFEHMNTNNVEKKILHLKSDYPHLINKINDTILSSFLAMSRESFVRNKKLLLYSKIVIYITAVINYSYYF